MPADIVRLSTHWAREVSTQDSGRTVKCVSRTYPQLGNSRPKPVFRFSPKRTLRGRRTVHTGIASMTHTGDAVSITRSSAKPEVWSSSPNSNSVRSRAVPNMAIICVSTR